MIDRKQLKPNSIGELQPVKKFVCGKCKVEFDAQAWGSLDKFFVGHFEKCGDIPEWQGWIE